MNNTRGVKIYILHSIAVQGIKKSYFCIQMFTKMHKRRVHYIMLRLQRKISAIAATLLSVCCFGLAVLYGGFLLYFSIIFLFLNPDLFLAI